MTNTMLQSRNDKATSFSYGCWLNQNLFISYFILAKQYDMENQAGNSQHLTAYKSQLIITYIQRNDVGKVLLAFEACMDVSRKVLRLQFTLNINNYYWSYYTFHNTLKMVHLNGKVNHRVVWFLSLVHHLLEYEGMHFPLQLIREKRKNMQSSPMHVEFKHPLILLR